MPRPPKNKTNNESTYASTAGDNPKSGYMKSKCGVIGKNIRDHRKQRRFSVESLAEYLELSASYIGLLERGDRCPSLKIVYKLCELFGVNPDDLLVSKEEAEGDLHVAEDGAAYNTKMQVDAIVSLIRTLNENELEFVIDTIKNLRKMGK